MSLENPTYTVKKWDTLSKIAKENNTTIQKIAQENNISDINKIHLWAKLKINWLKSAIDTSKTTDIKKSYPLNERVSYTEKERKLLDLHGMKEAKFAAMWKKVLEWYILVRGAEFINIKNAFQLPLEKRVLELAKLGYHSHFPESSFVLALLIRDDYSRDLALDELRIKKHYSIPIYEDYSGKKVDRKHGNIIEKGISNSNWDLAEGKRWDKRTNTWENGKFAYKTGSDTTFISWEKKYYDKNNKLMYTEKWNFNLDNSSQNLKNGDKKIWWVKRIRTYPDWRQEEVSQKSEIIELEKRGGYKGVEQITREELQSEVTTKEIPMSATQKAKYYYSKWKNYIKSFF